MPHQCIRCGKEYPDGSEALLSGCSCGAKFFFFFKEKMPEGMKIKTEQREQILEDVKEIIQENIRENIPASPEVKLTKEIKEETVIIDLESIKMTKQGKYIIDLAKLFARNPVIYKTGDGKYTIDLDSTFKLMKKKKS